jgi:hypothetical protein
MLRDLNPLFEQIVGPSLESKPVLSTAAAYIDVILRKHQDFLEKSVTPDRQHQWPTLLQQAQLIDQQAQVFFSEKISQHVDPYISFYDPHVQAAILECRLLLTNSPAQEEYDCTPRFLYACCTLIKALQDSSREFLSRGTQNAGARHASEALWFIGMDWNLGKMECLISAEYPNYERVCRQFNSSLFGCYLRLLHCLDRFNETISDPAWCNPLILPPENYPTVTPIPLSAQKASNGRFFTEEYFNEQGLSAAAQILHMRLKEYYQAQEDELGTVEMRYGPFTLLDGGNTLLLHGEVLSIAKRYHNFLVELVKNEGRVVDWSSMSEEAFGGDLKWENGNKYASDLRSILVTKTGHRMVVTEKKRGWRLDIGT